MYKKQKQKKILCKSTSTFKSKNFLQKEKKLVSKQQLEQWTWNLSLLLPNEAEETLEQEKQKIRTEAQAFVQKWSKRQDYLQEPKILAEALWDYEKWLYHYGPDGRQGLYFYLKQALALGDPTVEAKLTQINDLANQIHNQTQFFLLNIAKIPSEKQSLFLAETSLQPFRHFLTKIFSESKHLLSDAEEKIINYFSFHRDKWIRMTEAFLAQEVVELESLNKIQDNPELNSDLPVDGLSVTQSTKKSSQKIKTAKSETSVKKTERVTFGQLLSLLNHQIPEVRNEAAAKFNQILDKYKQVAEQELNAVLQHHKVLMELRGFVRPDQAKHLADAVDSQLVDHLLAAVESRFDLAQKFYKFKSKLFGKKKLAYHERNVPFGQIEQNFDWPKTLDLVRSVLAELDSEFVEILDRLVANRQIDVFPKVGKDSGAFCVHYRLSMPTFVFLNHTNRFKDVLTFAHEIGHACNFEMMRKNNLQLNWDTSLFLAEAPSTFMEELVLQKLLEKTKDSKEKLTILVEKLDTEISTIQRQAACYRFEQALHTEYQKVGYLSYQTIGQLFQKWMRAYMGPAVSQDPGSENWWIYWSHIRQHFYVYSYVSGLLVAKFMYHELKKNRAFITKIKKFFASDASQSPTEILADLGIEVNKPDFWLQSLEETEKLLNQAKRLAKRLQLL